MKRQFGGCEEAANYTICQTEQSLFPLFPSGLCHGAVHLFHVDGDVMALPPESHGPLQLCSVTKDRSPVLLVNYQ